MTVNQRQIKRLEKGRMENIPFDLGAETPEADMGVGGGRALNPQNAP
jgi:hypothetical protein